MALGFGPQPYIPPGPGKIPFRSWTANPLIDLSKVRTGVTGLKNFIGGQQLMLNAGPRVTPMGQVAGMTAWNPGQMPLTQQLPRMGGVDVSALYQKPGTMAQPLTRTLPRIGPAAGDVSNLLAPKAIGPAPSAIPMGPAPTPPAPVPSYTPTSSPGGVVASTADDLANLYTTKPTYNSIFSPVTSRLPSGLREMGMPKGYAGWKGALGGAAIDMGVSGLGRALLPEDVSIVGNQPAYKVTDSIGQGAGLGFTMFGPIGAGAGALAGASQGANKAMAFDQWEKNKKAEAEGKWVSWWENWAAQDPNDPKSHGLIPWIASMMSDEPDQPSAEQQQAAQAEAAAKYTPENIRSTALAMGIPAADVQPLIAQMQSQVAYLKGNPQQSAKQYDPETGKEDVEETARAIETLKKAGYEVSEDGDFIADDKFINEQAWTQAYQSLPTIQQKSIQTAEFARRNAALQAEIAGLLPRITGGMDPQMQQAVTAQLLQMPQYTAQMEQADAVKSMTAQILQQRQYAALQAAGLLPSSQSSTSSSDADVLAAALGG